MDHLNETKMEESIERDILSWRLFISSASPNSLTFFGVAQQEVPQGNERTKRSIKTLLFPSLNDSVRDHCLDPLHWPAKDETKMDGVGCGGGQRFPSAWLVTSLEGHADQRERQWLWLRSKEPQEGLWISGKRGGGRGRQAREDLAEVSLGWGSK